MRTLQILRHEKVLKLHQAAEHDDTALDAYAGAPPFPGISDADLLNTTIQVPDSPPSLDVEGRSRQKRPTRDAENAILVYRYLGALTRTQAADTRLWVSLAHTTFFEYVKARWGDDDRAELKKAVLRHWFAPRGLSKAALRTQAISRLWWAAHLTHAPWMKNPELEVFKTADEFRFTRILFRQQQIYMDLIERDYGSDLRLRACLLDSLDRHLGRVSRKDDLSSETSKSLNLLLKHRQIASLELGALRAVCDEVVLKVAALLKASPPSKDDSAAPEA
ncbi:DUF6339 family protein [Archangium lansingense]|uniref:DUF6339 family protein n=1 Tax=Archangium lansingense TaxID=2995310 RepID=UPI003B7E27F0